LTCALTGGGIALLGTQPLGRRGFATGIPQDEVSPFSPPRRQHVAVDRQGGSAHNCGILAGSALPVGGVNRDNSGCRGGLNTPPSFRQLREVTTGILPRALDTAGTMLGRSHPGAGDAASAARACRWQLHG
jgi:hypothetical protein